MKEKLQISLAAARVNAEMTQDESAVAMGKSKNTIVNWENGKTEISYNDARKLSEVYGIPLDNIKF